MRCNECNVDLAENYTLCPLCGAEAVSDEPKLKDIKDAPYPTSAPVKEKNVPKAEKNFSIEKIKAVFNL